MISRKMDPVNMLNCEFVGKTPTFYLFGNITCRGEVMYGKRIKINSSYFDSTPLDSSQFSIFIPITCEISLENNNIVPVRIIAWNKGFGIKWEKKL